ncbi:MULTISPECIES: hypothetical protein [Arsenophonus]|uniref:hypothetical protein n=1 Tax=Arsenophonus TaxID=637 RepID=UPI003879BCAA
MNKTNNALGVKSFLVFDINNQSSSKFFNTYDEAADYCIDNGISTFLEVGDFEYKKSEEISIKPKNFYFVPKNSDSIYVVDVNDFEEICESMTTGKIFITTNSNTIN